MTRKICESRKAGSRQTFSELALFSEVLVYECMRHGHIECMECHGRLGMFCLQIKFLKFKYELALPFCVEEILESLANPPP